MNGVKELSWFQEKKILVVESNSANALLDRIYLTSEWIHEENIIVVENILAAVEMAEREIFDVIIMGIDFPSIKWIEATKEIRKYYIDGIAPQIVAYTINPDIENGNEYKDVFDDVMVQPIRRPIFVHKIFDILTKQNTKTQRA